MTAQLQTFCRRHDLPWDADRRDRFEEYLDLLEQFNESMNLVGPMSRAEMVGDLLIDSLALAAIRPPHGRILDVGTGAGLPGVPLKIAFPDRPVALVEPRKKRSTFLRIVANRLDLEGVRRERTRIEELPSERFDYVVSKAFREPAAWLEVAADRTAPGGVAACMTTADQRATVEEFCRDASFEVVGADDDVAELGVPHDRDPRRAIYFVGRPEP